MLENNNTSTESVSLNKEQPVVTTQNLHASHTEASQNSKNMALIAQLGAIFFGFIPPLVLMLTQTEDSFIQRHSKESLNLAITTLIVYAMCIFTSFLVIPIFLMIIVGIANFIFCIIATIKASKGEDYRVPMPMLRLIK